MERKTSIFLTVFFIFLVVAGAIYLSKIPGPSDLQSQLSQNSTSSDNIEQAENADTLGIETSATPQAIGSAQKNMQNDKLIIQDKTVGTGAEAVNSKKVTVNYVGTLVDGTKFDSSYDRNEPFTFSLGAGEVIAGWDQGVAGMKVGGKRKLTIPPSLGYGSQDLGSIPPNSTLIFEVELLKVE